MIVDAIIIAFAGFFTWRGWKVGILAPLIRFVGFIAAVIAAVAGYDAVADVLRSMGFSNSVATITAALLIFIGMTVLAWFAARALTRVVNFTKWGLANRALGAALGAAWALAWAAVVLVAISYAPSGAARNAVDESVLAKAIAREAPSLVTRAARGDLRRLVLSLLG